MRTPTPSVPPTQPARRDDLFALGLTRSRLAGAVGRGTLTRLRPDVYVATAAVPADPSRRHLLQALAEQTARPDLIVSHESAALAWDLPVPGPHEASDPPNLTQPVHDRARSAMTRWSNVHVAALPAHHVTGWGDVGMRVTTPARTAIDLARDHDLPRALIPLDAALRAECQALLTVGRRSDLGNPRLRAAGLARLLEAAEVWEVGHCRLVEAVEFADPRRESPIESLSAGHMHLAGLPAPVPQAAFRTPTGLFFGDFYWEEARLIGEADGAVKYTDQAAIMREKQREQSLRDLGFRIVRWTGKEILLDPAVVMARIARALDC